jgi:hypothetical protein
MTVIHAQQSDNTFFLRRLEKKEAFWASPGSYLHKSTLISLARNISGLELPPSVYSDTTFEETTDTQKGQDTVSHLVASQLAAQLREATIESSRIYSTENSDDTNESDKTDAP